MKTSRIALLVVLALFPILANAADVRLSWTAPTTCEDNSPITNCPISGYEVSEAASPTSTWGIRETVASTVTSRIYQIPPGQRCFSVKTVSGTVKSVPSTTACVDVPVLPPKAPTGIVVTVQVTVATP
jgi:hypothetical protein